MPRADVFFSADIETDGPIPGQYSMLSFALVAVGRYDGERFERFAVPGESFEVELAPISPEYELEALAINGLDRDRLVTDGIDPASAMDDARSWVDRIAGEDRAVLVAYPVAFDWAFLYWYFVRFAQQGSPFGHSSCLDIRTLYLGTAGTVFDESGKSAMPASLRPVAPHTHDALDDAIEQGELFANVFEWVLRARRKLPTPGSDAPAWLAERFYSIT